jgi:hypothetical protein
MLYPAELRGPRVIGLAVRHYRRKAVRRAYTGRPLGRGLSLAPTQGAEAWKRGKYFSLLN